MPPPKAILRAVTAPLPPKDTSPNFIRFIFQANPGPVNCCTQNTTKDYLNDPSHPYHIKTTRRAAAFDPIKLYTSVSAHVSVAKKRVVRSWVMRRVRVALKEELRARGWGIDGRVLQTQEGSGNDGGLPRPRFPIRGALKIYMAKDGKEVITATGEEVRRNVSAIVQEIVTKQVRPSPQNSMPNPWRIPIDGDESGERGPSLPTRRRVDTKAPSRRRTQPSGRGYPPKPPIVDKTFARNRP